MNTNTLIIQDNCRDGINRRGFLNKTAGLLVLLSCFFLQGQATAYDKDSFGYLKVFSSTQQSQWGEGSYYYLHTGYRIYDSTGKVVMWVENHNTSIDEDPQKVGLAPGAYTIWAQSDKDGYVKVPVVIKLARTTTVHLEEDPNSTQRNATADMCKKFSLFME